MSWATSYSHSNNMYYNFPAIMDDGRNYASWQPGAEINNNLREKQGIITSSQYRKYLIANADKIIKGNQVDSFNETGLNMSDYSNDNNSNNTNNNYNSNGPFIFNSAVDNRKPKGYETSDLKNIYLTRHQIQSRMVSPVLTQEQLLKKM
tara:strand:+ start:165 stop:611 length:447 start_codon:yes stop_codon:yes gene_type:complete